MKRKRCDWHIEDCDCNFIVTSIVHTGIIFILYFTIHHIRNGKGVTIDHLISVFIYLYQCKLGCIHVFQANIGFPVRQSHWMNLIGS